LAFVALLEGYPLPLSQLWFGSSLFDKLVALKALH